MKLKRSLLLFGLLLVPCFSNAVNVVNDLGDYEDLGGNNNCTINSNYSFSCSESSNVIIGTDASWYKSSTSYFRTTSGLATYLYIHNGNNVQGYVSSLVYCGENSNPLQSCNSKHNITYEEFLTYKNSNQLKSRMRYSDASTAGYAGPAFIYDNSYILISPTNGTNYNGIITPYNFNLVGYGLQANWAGVGVINPSYVIGDNSSSSGNINSAQNLYDSYKSLGYRDEMCYGGFSIDNLYSTGSSLSNIKVMSGATIFELFNTYSGGVSFSRWWNDYFVDYSFFAQYGEYEPYLGKSKGLIGLFMMQEIYYKGNVVDPNLLYAFCALSLTNSSIDKSRSPLDYVNDVVLNNNLSNLVGDIGKVVPTSGSALDAVVASLSGYNNFDDVWNGAYNAINSLKGVSPGLGILPTYIGLGFLAFCLLYLLKK